MRSPVETVKGRIVGYDERRQELLIRAHYDDWMTMTKREFKECLVQPIDARPLSDKQRRSCYALLREIAEYTGQGEDTTKEYMKLKFLAEDLEETADKIFSLSNASMSLIAAFQRFLVNFILDWNIPTRFPLLNMVDDVEAYVYACLIHKTCAICGMPAELHHHDRIGAGRNRDEIDQEGMLALPLCREHHTEAHDIGQQTFDGKYHIVPVPIDKTLMKIYGLRGKRKRVDQERRNA